MAMRRHGLSLASQATFSPVRAIAFEREMKYSAVTDFLSSSARFTGSFSAVILACRIFQPDAPSAMWSSSPISMSVVDEAVIASAWGGMIFLTAASASLPSATEMTFTLAFFYHFNGYFDNARGRKTVPGIRIHHYFRVKIYRTVPGDSGYAASFCLICLIQC